MVLLFQMHASFNVKPQQLMGLLNLLSSLQDIIWAVYAGYQGMPMA